MIIITILSIAFFLPLKVLGDKIIHARNRKIYFLYQLHPSAFNIYYLEYLIATIYILSTVILVNSLVTFSRENLRVQFSAQFYFHGLDVTPLMVLIAVFAGFTSGAIQPLKISPTLVDDCETCITK